MNPLLNLPRVDENASLSVQVEQLKSCVYQLKEQIEIILQNISTENLSSELINEISETNQLSLQNTIKMGTNESKIQQTSNAIKMEVKRAEESEASLQLTADGIKSRVTTNEGDISTLTQRADSIETRVTSAEGDISTLTQTSSSIGTRVSTAEGDISSINQTVSGIETRVEDAEGDISTLTQTAEGLKTSVTSINKDLEKKGTDIQTLAGTYVVKVYNGNKLAFVKMDATPTRSNLILSADSISLNGYVKVNSNFEIDTSGNLKLKGSIYEVSTSTNTSEDGAIKIVEKASSSESMVLTSRSMYVYDKYGNEVTAIYVATNSNSSIKCVSVGDGSYPVWITSPTYPIVSTSRGYAQSQIETMATQEWVTKNFAPKE